MKVKKLIKVNKGGMFKIIKYKLAAFGISLKLAKTLKTRQLYSLLKKALKYEQKYILTKKELKQLVKDIQSVNLNVRKIKSKLLENIFNGVSKTVQRIKHNFILIFQTIYIIKFIKLFPISIE